MLIFNIYVYNINMFMYVNVYMYVQGRIGFFLGGGQNRAQSIQYIFTPPLEIFATPRISDDIEIGN